MAEENCRFCDGTGWRPVVRGEVSGVERCLCNPSRGPARLLESASIPPRFEQATFDNFDTRPENRIANEALSKVWVDARAFVRQYPAVDKPGLILMGLPGVGKTHLAVAVLKGLLDKGFQGLFFDYRNLLDRIMSGWNESAGSSERGAYQAVMDAEVLLLDDLGAHRVIEWVEDTIFSIINHRYNEKKATIVTTNLPDPDLGDVVASKNPASGKYSVHDTLADRIGARARSRLFEMCRLVRITATEDYRLRGVR